MLDLSPRIVFIILVGMNSLFVISGIGLIIYTTLYIKIGKFQLQETQMASYGVLNIVVGVCDVLVGACGLCGAIFKSRSLLIANAAVLSAVVAGNGMMAVMLPVYGYETIKTTRTNIRANVIANYGNMSDSISKEITDDINEHHKEDGCCNFSEDDGQKNIYIETAWFRSNNINEKAEPRTVPDSCCLVVNDRCQSTASIKFAKENGYVYKEDCLSRIIGRIKVLIWTSVGQLIFAMLVQSSVVTFLVVILVKRITPEL